MTTGISGRRAFILRPFIGAWEVISPLHSGAEQAILVVFGILYDLEGLEEAVEAKAEVIRFVLEKLLQDRDVLVLREKFLQALHLRFQSRPEAAEQIHSIWAKLEEVGQ